jgi:hypothetical protein
MAALSELLAPEITQKLLTLVEEPTTSPGESPEAVLNLTRQGMVEHMTLRAAAIKADINRRYIGSNAKLRPEKYNEALDTEMRDKMAAWSIARDYHELCRWIGQVREANFNGHNTPRLPRRM